MGPVWTECLNGLLFIFLFAHLGCTSVDDPDGRVCDLETSGDTFCSGTLLERCHAVDEMAGHLHSTDCGLDGYSCVELDERNATCADETVGCSLNEASCSEDGSASGNCVDDLLHIDLCESGSLCRIGSEGAACELTSADECAGHGAMTDDGCACESGYRQQAGYPTNCVLDSAALCELFEHTDHIHATLVAETLGAWEDGSGGFAAVSNAPLMEVVEVDLSGDVPGYVHFPVALDGNYVVMLDSADSFEGFVDREGLSIESRPEGPLSACPSVIVEHHVSGELVNDGQDTVPYLLTLQRAEGAGTLRFLLAHVPAALEE